MGEKIPVVEIRYLSGIDQATAQRINQYLGTSNHSRLFIQRVHQQARDKTAEQNYGTKKGVFQV